MIVIGIGANLNHPTFGAPREICGRALEHMSSRDDMDVLARSQWYRSAPVIRSTNGDEGRDHPWYVNAAVSLETALSPQALLETLLTVEASFGRVRTVDDAPRTLDLDIVAYHDQKIETGTLIVPHPRLAERGFVVLPLCDLYADWKHPQTGRSAQEIRAYLPPSQAIETLPDADGLFGTEWRGSDLDRS